MSHPDGLFHSRPSGDHPLYPVALPPELTDYLRGEEYACVTEATDIGTVLVFKLPTPDIESVRGPVPILLQQELYKHPAAPVIRMVVDIFDQPDSHLTMETYINIHDPQQHGHFAALENQHMLPMFFYDEVVAHRLTKVIPNRRQEEAATILTIAEQMAGAIPEDRFSFDLARGSDGGDETLRGFIILVENVISSII
jgi:hypothetical protein